MSLTIEQVWEQRRRIDALGHALGMKGYSLPVHGRGGVLRHFGKLCRDLRNTRLERKALENNPYLGRKIS